MSEALGGRRPVTAVVHNSGTAIAAGEPVEILASYTAVGGSPETIAGTFDPSAPAEPIPNIQRQILDAGGATDGTFGIARTNIAAGAEGEVVVWGPALAKVLSNGAKAVGAGEVVSVAAQVGTDAHVDDDVTLPLGMAMEAGDWDTTPGTQNLTWVFVNAIGRIGLGGT
tara:strand:+ start:2438 stop:2944 length:507 start_codon:yes stop_codon:yes gene_type:complete